MNSKKVLSTILAVSLLAQPLAGNVVYAAEIQHNENSSYENSFEYYEELPLKKQIELDNIAKEFNMSPEDIKDIKDLYFKNKMYKERGKVGAVLKIIKVAKATLTKAAKMFGMKMAEKELADFADYLFEWQGDLQDGIENFLVYNWGWSRDAAHWAAKTIMFIAF